MEWNVERVHAETLNTVITSSSLSDLSKNRDYLKYYVSSSPEIIVELRLARYFF